MLHSWLGPGVLGVAYTEGAGFAPELIGLLSVSQG